MKIETKFYGLREVDEKEFINFSHGIPGFENYHQYILLNHKENSPFMVMQSAEKADLALILIGLEQVVPGYAIDLNEEIVAELGLTKPEEAAVFAVVSMPAEIAKATVNLAAPICINSVTRRAKQVILNNPAYGLKHPLFAPATAKEPSRLPFK